MRINREISERKEWFTSKIGKTLFRNDNGCSCPVCQSVVENGLIVRDKYHAIYLYDNECDYNAEGNPLKYFDTKEAATEFSIQQEK